MKDNNATKVIPIQLYTTLLCSTKVSKHILIYLTVIHDQNCKKKNNT